MKLRSLAAALLLAILGWGPARAAQAEGDWLGALPVSPALTLRLAVHIHKALAGGYSGTIDSLDQGLYDGALSEVVAEGDRLSFKDPKVGAVYAAKWDASTHRWMGQWTQGARAPIPLNLAAGVAPTAPTVTGLDGEWDGTLYLGTGLSLRLAFHIVTGPHGTIGTVDSPDQGSYGVPLSGIARGDGKVRIEMKALGAVLEGPLSIDGQTLAGSFTQGGMTLPLVLRRLPAGSPSPWPAPAGGPAAALPVPNWTPPSDGETRKLLAQRIDTEHQGVGMVVGIIDRSGRRIVAYGRSDQGDARPLNGDTVFEIGSITKVFTAVLLTDAVSRGDVRLDDSASKYLPPDVRMPEHGGKAITLADLATHTSGLPRLPSNFAPKDMADPYADYTVAQLYQFLSGYQLTRDPGAGWEYSNLGFGLLGHILSRRAGLDYEALVKQRIIGPLGMASTAITLTPDETARMAVGHDSSLARAANWTLPTLAGAGALRSTANDLLTFLSAALGLADTPLKADMAATQDVRRPTESGGLKQALGWEVIAAPNGETVFHSGGTGGYRALIGYNRSAGFGVVVLSNAETPMGVDDIGLHLLTGAPVAVLPPPAQTPQHTAVTLAPQALQAFVGRYQLSPQVVVTVTREQEHLFAQLTGQSAFEVFPESATSVFWKVVPAQATFQLGPDGHAAGLVLHQNGLDMPAPLIKGS